MANHISTQEAVAAWKVAHRFVLDVYRLTNKLPREEHYGLIPKVRTSSVKVASNIVEGYARKSAEFYLKHLTESQVALEETKYSLLVARDLGYINETQYDRVMAQGEELSERLNGLQTQLAVTADGERPAVRESSGGWFATTHGVREAWTDAWTWFKGGREKLRERQAKRDPQIWVEEPTRGYLDTSED